MKQAYSLPLQLLMIVLLLAVGLQPGTARADWMDDFTAELNASPTASIAWYDNFQSMSEISACMHMNSSAPSGELLAKVSFSLGSLFSSVRDHWENLFLPRMMMCVPFALGRVTERFMERLLAPGGMAFNLVLVVMSLAVTVFGVRLATGGIQNIKGEAGGFILKLAFVLFWAMEGHNFVAPLFNTMNQLIGLVADSVSLFGLRSLSCPMLNFGTGAMSLWYRGDCVLQQMIGVGGSIIEGNPEGSSTVLSQAGVIGAALFTPGAKGLFLIGLAAIVVLLMFMFKALFYVLYAFVLASFLMVLSVFIIPLILFQKTSQYFQTWTSLVLSTVLQPAVMIAYFCLILILLDFTLTWAPGNRFDILEIPRPQGELTAAMNAEGATGDPRTFMEGRVQRNLAYNQPLLNLGSPVDPQAYRIWEMCQDPNNPKVVGTVDPDVPGSGQPLLDDYGNPVTFPDYNACYTYASEDISGNMAQSIADMLKNPAAAVASSLPATVTRIFTSGAQEARNASDPDADFAGEPEKKNLYDIFWMIGNSFFLLLTSALSLVLMKDVEQIAEKVGGAAGPALSLSKPGFSQGGAPMTDRIGQAASNLSTKGLNKAGEAVGSGVRNMLGVGKKNETTPRAAPGQVARGGASRNSVNAPAGDGSISADDGGTPLPRAKP